MKRLGITLASAVASGLALTMTLTLGSMPPAAAKEPSTPTLLTPAAGAVVPPNPDGIAVTFDCPGFALDQYGRPNFWLRFNTTGETNSEGWLVSGLSEPTNSDIVFDGNRTCSAIMKTQLWGDDATHHYLRPEVSGGQVFWQASADDGVASNEPLRSAIQNFVISQPAPGELSAPKRVYAGYTTRLTYDNDAETNGAPATLERFDGAAWVPVANDTFNGRLRLFNEWPRGESTLRVTLALPSGPLSSPPITIDARGNKGRVTSRRNNGKYRVTSHDGFMNGARGTAKVARKGRVLKGLDLRVKAVCFSFEDPGPDPRIRSQFGPIRVAPDGTFAVKTSDAAGGITSEVVGRLRRDRIRMSIDISKLGCTALGDVVMRKR